MNIPDEIFSDIIASNDIVEVISSYIQLRRRGNTFVGLCPFHPDKNPSLHISQDRQLYHCFSCKVGGNVITFVKEYEKITPIEAVERLAIRAGIDIKKYSRNKSISQETNKIYTINKIAATYFHNNLLNAQGEEKEIISRYLKKREINRALATAFGIGYARDQYHHLQNYFIENEDYTTDELIEAGLLKKNENNIYDRFRGRLIFPIFNEGGLIAGFGGRILTEKEDTAKYINSPETKVYNKSKILYGLNFAKDSIRSQDYLILVEGYMDVVSLHNADIKNVVASSGTALTREQVHIISRYTKNIVVIYDGDRAGINAAKRGIEIILSEGLNIDIVSLPENDDPDSYVKKHGKEVFLREINKKQDIIEFISSIYEKEGKLDTVDEKTRFIKEIISYIVVIPDRIKISFYIKELSRKYGILESDMREELLQSYKDFKNSQDYKSSIQLPAPAREYKANKKINNLRNELEVVRMIIECNNEEVMKYIENNLYFEYISDKNIQAAISILLDEWINEGIINTARIISRIDNEEISNIIINESVPKHEILKSDYIKDDNLLHDYAISKIDYMKLAKDTITRLQKMHISRRLRKAIDTNSSQDDKIRLFIEKGEIYRKK